MDATELTLPWPLDRQLPPELTGTGHTWLTRYRTWPVYSPQWVRGRLRALGMLFGMLYLALFAMVMLAEPADRPLTGLVQAAINLFGPLLAGPWLACWVRRQGWPRARERWALVAAVALVVLAQHGFNRYLAEPMKQAVAQAIGDVDASGKRRLAALTIGLSIGAPPETPASAPMTKDGTDGAMSQAIGLFAMTAATFFLAGGAGLRRRRLELDALAALAQDRELAQARAQRHEAEMQLSVLAAQVEPHFLFNTLAGVRSAIATDPPRAAELVDRLVDYLRAAIPRLRSDGGAAATLAGQVDIVRAYLALMRTRMPRLRFEIDVPESLAGQRFPPLMLISLAENAVKHGVEPKVGPARIQVQARRGADGRLAVTVEDDGVGFGGDTAGSGLGLSNLRTRLQALYQGRAELTLRSRPEGGVAATISVPAEGPEA